MTEKQKSQPTGVKPLRFVRRGEIVTLHEVPPTRTLLQVLREDLGLTGTKEGCGEGDCGACTVVVAELNSVHRGADGDAPPAALQFKTINSCIRFAHAVDGMALWTVQDLATTTAGVEQPHPVQEALVEHHGSQCGFCTPGFVMGLFGLYENTVCAGQPVSRALAQRQLSGNLCRCTGYRPILDAAQSLPERHQARPCAVDQAPVIEKLKQLQELKLLPPPPPLSQPEPMRSMAGEQGASRQRYDLPLRLTELLALRAAFAQAQLVAGGTDVGLWVTKQHRHWPHVLDLSQVKELRRIENDPHHLVMGAAVSLESAFQALCETWPELDNFASRFAGLPVRHSGTLGGNIANGSPIGDSMPLLIALGANVVLMRQDPHAETGTPLQREMPLEDLYTGYRQSVMRADEVLAWIKVPKPVKAANVGAAHPAGQGWLRAYKISKRFDDDISAVCLVIRLNLKEGRVTTASIGVGGVAATPVRARQTEASLTGQVWSEALAQSAAEVLQNEFNPLSDLRGSSAYRVTVLGGLMRRFWLESQGHAALNLATLSWQDFA